MAEMLAVGALMIAVSWLLWWVMFWLGPKVSDWIHRDSEADADRIAWPHGVRIDTLPDVVNYRVAVTNIQILTPLEPPCVDVCGRLATTTRVGLEGTYRLCDECAAIWDRVTAKIDRPASDPAPDTAPPREDETS